MVLNRLHHACRPVAASASVSPINGRMTGVAGTLKAGMAQQRRRLRLPAPSGRGALAFIPATGQACDVSAAGGHPPSAGFQWASQFT